MRSNDPRTKASGISADEKDVMRAHRHEVIVVGDGLSGCAAALECARLGYEVLFADRTELAPTEEWTTSGATFAAFREVALQWLRTSRFGTTADSSSAAARKWGAHAWETGPILALRAYAARVREAIERGRLLVERGAATLVSSREIVLANGQVHAADAIILVTTTRPRRPPRFAFDDLVVCDGESVFRLPAIPRSVTVIGADAVGCEFASLFGALGSHVTLVDRRRRLLRFVDRDVLEVFHRRMQRAGVEVVLEESVEDVTVEARGAGAYAIVRLGSGRAEVCDCVIVLAGGVPASSELHLDRVGVETDAQGFIRVDDRFQSSASGVFAVGDLIGPTGRNTAIAWQIRTALFHAHGSGAVPEGGTRVDVYSIPEMAMTGFTDEACRMLGVACDVGYAQYTSIPMGAVRGEPDDVLKLVVGSDDHRILGVHLVGDGATELLSLGVSLVERGASVDEVAAAPSSALSLSDLYRIAALDALERIAEREHRGPSWCCNDTEQEIRE